MKDTVFATRGNETSASCSRDAYSLGLQKRTIRLSAGGRATPHRSEDTLRGHPFAYDCRQASSMVHGPQVALPV